MNKFKILVFISCLLITQISESYGQENSDQAKVDRLTKELFESKKKQDFDTVIIKANEIIKLAPDSAQIYQARGVGYFSKSKYKNSISDLSKAIELGLDDRTKFASVKLRAISFYRLKNYPDAIKDFDFLLTKEPEQKGFYRFRGVSNFYLENYSDAIKDFDKEISLNPSLAESYKYRAKSYRKVGKVDLADKDEETYVEKSVDLFDRSIHSNNYDEALLIASELVKLYPVKEIFGLQGIAYSLRAINSIEKGEYKKAIADFDKAIELDNTSTTAFLGRGKTYLFIEDLDKAFADATKALEIDPKNYSAHSIISGVYFEREEFNKSITEANKALAHDKDDIFALRFRGFSLSAIEKSAESLKDLNRVIKDDGQDIEALTIRAVNLIALERWVDARKDSNSILTMEKDDVGALILRATTNYALQENFQQVVDDFNRVEKLAKELVDADLYAMRGASYRKLGKIKEADADEKMAKLLEEKAKKGNK